MERIGLGGGKREYKRPGILRAILIREEEKEQEKDRRQRVADLPGGNVCSLHLFMLQKPRLAREISVISSENR